jgi:hypothetical protein
MIAAVAAGKLCRVEIDPVFLGAARKVISAVADPTSLQSQAALETIDVNAASPFKIDCRFHSLLLPSLLTSSQIKKTYR